MKKILFSVAILATLASCSKSEVVEQSQSDAIEFSTLNDRVVAKSANDAKSAYMVYSSYYGDPTTSDWYFNVTVNGESDEPTTTQYWPLGGDALNFYAYAPAAGITPSVSVKSDAGTIDGISIAYTVSEAAQEDFTVAEAVEDHDSEDGSVGLIFSHKLAKVTVEVVLSENLTTPGYSLADGYTANIGVTYNKETMEVTTGDWASDASSDATGFTGDVITHIGSQSYMILPQTATDATITVTGLTINKPDTSADAQDGDVIATNFADETLEAYVITASDIATFEEGKHYYITLTVDNNSAVDGGTNVEDELDDIAVISFTSSLIDWGASNVGDAEVTEDVDVDATEYTSGE